MAISPSVARREQLVERVAEPGFEDLNLGLGHRHALGPIISLDCSMSCTNWHACRVFSRTSRGVSDLSMLFRRPTAPHLAAFYLAIARSAGSSSPFLRGPSPNCDQTKTRPSATGAGSAHVRCSRYAESLMTARASRVAKSTEAGTQELRRLCRLFADRAQEGDKQTGLGRTW
jgi:hypothetical protein